MKGELEHLVGRHHYYGKNYSHPMAKKYTSYVRGGNVKGKHEDYESEEDTIPALLQAGELVLPRVYASLGMKMLRKEKLPLPIPKKVETVMSEFKHKKLHDSHGKLVKDRKQAIAIALDVARRSNK